MTVSAGNAAQACAYAAHKLGVPCRVVMFDTAPQTKVAGVKRWGATPIPMPRDQLFQWIATQGWKDEPESFIHPFADEEVMAGHGGLGLELVEDVPDLRRVVVPVGGGGPVSLQAQTIADGTTAPFDARMFDLLKKTVDRWLIVQEPRLKAAILQLAAAAKVVAEGAGALAYAALEQLEPGPTTVAVVSGGNIDTALLAELLG